MSGICHCLGCGTLLGLSDGLWDTIFARHRTVWFGSFLSPGVAIIIREKLLIRPIRRFSLLLNLGLNDDWGSLNSLYCLEGSVAVFLAGDFSNILARRIFLRLIFDFFRKGFYSIRAFFPHTLNCNRLAAPLIGAVDFVDMRVFFHEVFIDALLLRIVGCSPASSSIEGISSG